MLINFFKLKSTYMKSHNTLFLPLFLLLCAVPAFTQSNLSIGQWKSHLPFKEGISVTQSDDKVYYATRYALLIFDKADRAVERLTKVEGLSQTGVQLVKFNRPNDILLIVYNNGAIDLLHQDQITTLPNIPNSNILIGEKKVFNVFMDNDSMAYLSANFGITTLNLKSGLFPNTIKTPMPVYNSCIFKDYLYAATDEGICRANLKADYNINDFSNWEWMGQNQGFPDDFSANSLVVYQDKLYASVDDSLFAFDGNNASFVFQLNGFSPRYLSAEGSHLLAGFSCGSNCQGKVLVFDAQLNYRPAGSSCVNLPTYAIEDEQGAIWYADEGRLFRVEENGSGACQTIDINSPHSINVYKMSHANNQLWIATGGVNLTYSPLFRRSGFLSLKDSKWDYHSSSNVGALSEVFDFLDIRIHPENGKIFAAAFMDALVAYDPANGEYQVFNETNSSLQLAELDPARSRVAGMDFDEDNNLWICNHNAPRPLSVYYDDGSWQNFDPTCTSDNQFFKVVVDDFGNKWLMSTNSSTGIVVFNEGNPSDPLDDRCKTFNTANSALPTNEVNTLEKDRDGAIWVGTKSGALVFQCNPFDENSSCTGTRPYVEVDGIGANLLEYQDVRAVAVDGANRKWFGTSTGVFLMSPEGNEQIAHFTTANSPLFDDNITDIAFDPSSGEVFIGTQLGLISYRAEATQAENYHSTGVQVFPNPVRPEYDGVVAVKGLAQDATIKITDISGQLVFESQALGGQAIWDGRDYNGRKVQSGVYLVLATSRNSFSPEVVVAKILFLN